MTLALGLDVGTTKTTALAMDFARDSIADRSREDRIVALATRPTVGYTRSATGRVELDLARLRVTVVEVLAEVAATLGDRGADLGGIGVTGQMHGVAFLSPTGEPSGPAITWQDQRVTEPEPGGDASYLDRFREQAGPGAFDRTGCQPAPGYLGTTLYWLQRTGQLPPSPVRACFIPDAAVALLTGAIPPADPTNAASSGLFDVQAGTWDRELVRRLGLLERLLPTVAPSGARAGVLQGDVARSIGLRGGTPVFVALGDNQASVLGSVREYEHTLIVNIGTGGQISARLEDCAFVPGLDTRPFPGGRYLLVGAGLTGGRSYAWLRDLFRAIGVAFFGARGDEDLYDAMTALAAAVPPGADGLCCEPLFTGSRRDPSRRGTFAGVGVANATPGHLARAVLEGMVEQFHQFFTSMAPVIGETRQLVGAGNGIRRNPVLAQILSRRFSLPLHRPVTTEQAATGAAMVAAVGCGTIGSLREAARYVRYEEVVEPE